MTWADRKPDLKYTRWELASDSTPADARVAAWHATYNAALTAMTHGSDYGSHNYKKAPKGAARLANKTHGPIRKFVVKLWYPDRDTEGNLIGGTGGGTTCPLHPPKYKNHYEDASAKK